MHFQLDTDTETYRDGVRDHLSKVMTPEFEEQMAQVQGLRYLDLHHPWFASRA